MTNKEIAQRLRELDETPDLPPRPESDTFVYCKTKIRQKWEKGITAEDGIWLPGSRFAEWEDIAEWKPARIAGPMQVIVDIPRVSDWPKKCNEITLRWHYDDRDFMSDYAGATITRAEAERLEAEG